MLSELRLLFLTYSSVCFSNSNSQWQRTVAYFTNFHQNLTHVHLYITLGGHNNELSPWSSSTPPYWPEFYPWTIGEFRFDRTIRSEKYRISDVRYPILDVQHPMSDEHHPNFGKNLSDLGPNIGSRTSDIGSQTSDIGSRTSDIGSRTCDIGSWTSEIRYRMNIFLTSGRTFQIWEEKRSDIRSGWRTWPNLNSPYEWDHRWISNVRWYLSRPVYPSDLRFWVCWSSAIGVYVMTYRFYHVRVHMRQEYTVGCDIRLRTHAANYSICIARSCWLLEELEFRILGVSFNLIFYLVPFLLLAL